MEEDHRGEQEQPPAGARTTGARFLIALGLDPSTATVGDRRLAVLGVATGLAILIVVVCGYVFGWAWTGLAKRTFWDWLHLLIVPAALALGGYVFARRAESRQRMDDMYQRERDRVMSDQHAKADREISEQRAQDETLQVYLDQMGTLLLHENLRNPVGDSEVETLARARTLTVLRRLDPNRKTQVIQFLAEANLVGVEGRDYSDLEEVASQPKPVISLEGANLRHTNLRYTNLSGADLRDANLRHANLIHADLRGANLGETKLGGASLVFADLRGANLSGAKLGHAKLNGADLRGAVLALTDLSFANLFGADLTDARLVSTLLGNANLRTAEGVTNDQLEQPTSYLYLDGTIMPDGTIHAGRYVTSSFEPAQSFTVGEGWHLPDAWEATNALFIEGPGGGELKFTRPLRVFDPNIPSEEKEVPAPENAVEWVSWFHRHPYLDTSEPVPMSVAGASGMRIDVTTTSAPGNYPRDYCERPCVLLYPVGLARTIFSVEEGSKHRFVIVDVGGKTVVIDISAPADKSDGFLPKGQKVLDTVEWVRHISAPSGEDG